jgi:glycosyltransferase involved in cell wall biosynthesis
MIKHMAKVFVVNKRGCAFYKKKYPFMAERFMFLPMWFDENIFNISSGTIEARDNLSVVWAGRFETPKDPMLLIRVFRNLSEKLSGARLTLIGDGSLLHGVKEYIIKNNIRCVAILGPLKPDKLARIFRRSEVYLLTSAFEGMPRVVLEAMACGVPVVTTNAGDVAMVVGDSCGKIVFSRDEDELAGAVIEVLNKKIPACVCAQAAGKFSRAVVLTGLKKEIF